MRAIPLDKADLSRPFLYARFIGVRHFDGEWIEAMRHICFQWYETDFSNLPPLAVHHCFFRMISGTCMFDPAVSLSIIAAHRKNLTRREQRILGNDILFFDQAKKVSDG
jgi:hypothetical protein